MKWFEHQTSAGQNKKIRKIEVFYKPRGNQAVMAAIGRFWRLHEIVGNRGLGADGLDTFALPDDYGMEVLADDLFCSQDELIEFLDLLASINSIDQVCWGEKRKVFLPKLAERADTYTKRRNIIKTEVIQGSKSVRTGFEECVSPQAQAQDLNTPPTPPSGGNGAGDFLRWFEAYPERRRKDKLKAEQQWNRQARRGLLPPMTDMLRILEQQKSSDEWAREEGRYIPLPHKYLKLGRYVDASVEAPARRDKPLPCIKCCDTGKRRALAGEIGDTEDLVPCECQAKKARAP